MLDLPWLAWIGYPGETPDQKGQLGRDEAYLVHDRDGTFLTFLASGFEGTAPVGGAAGTKCPLTRFTRNFAPLS